jgi:hypothetical protein
MAITLLDEAGHDALDHTGLTGVGGGGSVGAYDIERYTGGNITVNSTTAGAALSGPGNLVIAAAAGDLLLVGISTFDVGSDANSMRMDVATIVSAAAVNFVSSASGTPASLGVTGWLGFVSEEYPHIGSVPYVVQAGDISGGNVTLRLCAWVGAGSRTLNATAAGPLIFWAKNLLQ